MPDAVGNFKGISVPAEAWERIFVTGPTPPTPATREEVAEFFNEARKTILESFDRQLYGKKELLRP